MPYCWCPLVTYKDEKLSRANVHVMGKFVMFILISIVYFGLVQRLNIKRNVIPPSLFISLHLLISRLRDLNARESRPRVVIELNLTLTQMLSNEKAKERMF